MPDVQPMPQPAELAIELERPRGEHGDEAADHHRGDRRDALAFEAEHERRGEQPHAAREIEPLGAEVIGAAWGLGGAEPGCAEAPAVLTPLVIAELQRCGVPLRAGPILSPSRAERRRQLAVSKLCGLLASAVSDSISRGHLPCVLGGDHSCAGGTWT